MIRRAAVYGLGYVGLPTAAVFAEAGVEIIGVDVNEAAVASINAGRPHIVEPGLDVALRRVVEEGRLRATTEAVEAEAHVIAVPTPFKEGKRPDLSYIESVAGMIAPVLRAGDIVILESTSPVGATEQLAEWLATARPDLTFPQQAGDLAQVRLAHCPERVLPGQVLHEVVHNARVIGGMTRRCGTAAAAFYRAAVKGDLHITNARTAELAKLTENAFRDVNIAFANELSVICEDLHINVWELIALSNKHPRVNILWPGPGVGGHCIAVDPWFIVDSAPETAKLIRSAREINDSKPDWVVARVREKAEKLKSPTIACLGLAYKPDVDDLRESPSIEVVRGLIGAGRILVAEPYVDALPAGLEGAELCDFNQAIEAADIIVVLTGHDVFRSLDPQDLDRRMLFDTCGLFRRNS